MDGYLLLVAATALGGIVAIYYGWRLLSRPAATAEEQAANQAPQSLP